jgi:hypothetical protein
LDECVQERQTKDNIAAAEKKIAAAQAKAQNSSDTVKASPGGTPTTEEDTAIKAPEDNGSLDAEAASTRAEEAVETSGMAAVEGEN